MKFTKFLIVIIILSISFKLHVYSYAGDVLFIDSPDYESNTRQTLELACRFYGLSLASSSSAESSIESIILDASKNSEIGAIIISANIIANSSIWKTVEDILKKTNLNVPFLITDVTPETDNKVLGYYSGGAIIGCADLKTKIIDGSYKISEVKQIARELAGIDFQKDTRDVEKINYLLINQGYDNHVLLEIVDKNEHARFPIFFRKMVNGREVFVLSGIPRLDTCKKFTWKCRKEKFFDIAPFLMFLRYSFSNRCWHMRSDYANFIIDDPWLTEPYGNLSYNGLLNEMEKYNYHTTIAFVPWNFDRNKFEVVSIFRGNPDKFSICIHGNNHDHMEFDRLTRKPLTSQVADIKQAIARMEKFKSLTGLSYGKVMVFPHGIAPAETLGMLRKYDFLATCNGKHVPLGSENPTDEIFSLRTFTVNFKNFPSIDRIKIDTKTLDELEENVAIDLFLDTPVVFYTHQNFFRNGNEAFNKIARMVNKIGQTIEWQSLGDIAKNLYYQRVINTTKFEVEMFSSNVRINNDQKSDVTYLIKKKIAFDEAIKDVTLNGKSSFYDIRENYLNISVNVPAKKNCNIVIEHENDLDVASVDISKNSIRINLLRKLSDFRDMVLSKSTLGNSFINLYYRSGLFKFGLLLFIPIGMLILIAYWSFSKLLLQKKP